MKNIATTTTMATNSRNLLEMCERKKAESIHSGQFMVSHIENNEDEDDEEEASEVRSEQIMKLLSSAEGEAASPAAQVVAPCTDLVVAHHRPTFTCSDLGHIIDTDLSTVFNTLNVTYT